MENTAVKESVLEEDFDKKYEEYFTQGRIEFITFHPSYSYEEFVEGITVETKGENIPCENIQYKLQSGIFKNMCKKALGAAIGLTREEVGEKSWKEVYADYHNKRDDVEFEEAPKYVLIIDEINRGDMAKIFGELITLLEADKRIKADNQLIVTLPTSGDKFGVPPNLYIIATMNTADRSIALIDVALRRRFGFVEMNPDFKVLQDEHIDKNKDKFEENVCELLTKSKEAIQKINREICGEATIGRDKQIGHSFLFKVYTINDLLLVWRYEVFPLLEEYCYGDYKKINKILFNKDSDTEWISEAEGIRSISDLSTMLEAILKHD
jgi:5-methylcytosine-specific restriction protein B|tara:strand:- start:1312 stop:2283 length:972 start_codon:yes stop_codon:yes gene_type:complete